MLPLERANAQDKEQTALPEPDVTGTRAPSRRICQPGAWKHIQLLVAAPRRQNSPEQTPQPPSARRLWYSSLQTDRGEESGVTAMSKALSSVIPNIIHTQNWQ